MKKILLLTIALTSIFASCQSVGSSGTSTPQIDSVSFALGQMVGANFKPNIKGFELSLSEFNRGFNGAFEQDIDQETLQATNTYIQNFMTVVLPAMLQEVQDAYVVKLEANADLKKTESGLFYQIVEAGDLAVKPIATDTVVVNYVGTTIDGEKFDSSFDRGEAATFPLNGVIRGWTEGVQLIGKGGKIKLYIPSDLAYGPQGHALSGQLLVFEIDLEDVKKGLEQK